MTRTIFIAAALALAVTLPAVSAQAQAPRTFVSAAGNDSNPCTFAAPCRHFQNAVNVTSDGGEVDALDPAGYGPIVIHQAITIEGQGWSYIAPPTGGNGIAINARSDSNVTIHGVLLNGAGITGQTNGILFQSGGSLTVTDCVIRNFSGSGNGTAGDGILIQPTSGAINFGVSGKRAAISGHDVHCRSDHWRDHHYIFRCAKCANRCCRVPRRPCRGLQHRQRLHDQDCGRLHHFTVNGCDTAGKN
jgi:hypothetical protein